MMPGCVCAVTRSLMARCGRIGTVPHMIRLTRLRQDNPLYLNPDHIERLDRNHETVVHLLNGTEYVVLETPEEIVEQVTYMRARAIALAAKMAVADHDPGPFDAVQIAGAVAPLPEVGGPDDEPGDAGTQVGER